MAAKPVTEHSLPAVNYSLGPPNFGAPALHEVTPLKAANYSLAPLVFSVPAWRQGYRRACIVWGKDGRPPRIPDGVKERMIAATEGWLTEKQITDIKRMGQADREALKRYVRGLAKEAGIQASNTILQRQIIRAAFRNIAARATT
jgi:hypothetical protein